jgi:hypothetical protein
MMPLRTVGHARRKRPVTASKLALARIGRDSTADPWIMTLRFKEAGGLAAVEGHQVIARMRLNEVAGVVGVIPLAIMSEDGEDLKAVRRVMAMLERTVKERPDDGQLLSSQPGNQGGRRS